MTSGKHGMSWIALSDVENSLSFSFLVNHWEATNELVITNSFCEYFTGIGEKCVDKILKFQYSIENYITTKFFENNSECLCPKW